MYIYCDVEDPCSPAFAVHEVRIWTDMAISIYGTPYNYDGNDDTITWGSTDADKVFKTGSYTGDYYCDWTTDNYSKGQGSEAWVGLHLEFPYTVVVTEVITYIACGHSGYGLALGTRSFNEELNYSSEEIIWKSSSSIPTWHSVEVDVVANNFGSLRNEAYSS